MTPAVGRTVTHSLVPGAPREGEGSSMSDSDPGKGPERETVGLHELGEELQHMAAHESSEEVNARELAVERRLIEKAKREQYQHWEARVYEHRKRVRSPSPSSLPAGLHR